MAKKEKIKMTKDVVPQNFTIGLSLVDAVPVIFFGLSFIMLGVKLGSFLFLAGVAMCLFAGAAKVLWKIIVVLKQKNVWWLFLQMRILMPVGFLLMILGFVLKLPAIDGAAVLAGVVGFPSMIFFILGFLGMVLMGVFASVFDSSDLKANWIEQITNGVAQICVFVGILLI